MTHQILSLEDDYSLLKLKLAIGYLELTESIIIKQITLEELLKIDPNAKSLLLLTGDNTVMSVANSILFFIASQASIHGSKKILHGKSPDDNQEIEKWLRLSWDQLEIPLQALLGIISAKPEFILTPDDRIKVEQKSYLDIQTFLRDLDKHLSLKTFIVGESMTFCDISIFSVLTATLKFHILDKEYYPTVCRWFMTIGSILSAANVYDFTPVAEIIQLTTTSEPKSTGKWSRHRIRIKELIAEGLDAIGKEVTIKGWVRTSRSAEKGQLLFVQINDGSTPKTVQLVMTAGVTIGMESVAVSGGVHASISIKGKVVLSPSEGQTIEIAVLSAQVLGPIYGGEHGEIGGKNYPLAKKAHGMEYLREIAHLRPRSKVFSSALRIRNAMAFATHKFFNDRGFVYVHTPLITGADCEGAGEQFTVTTLLKDETKVADIKSLKSGLVDYSQDFFGKRCALTVSGQLNVETHACALSDVYTFGPTFRAENSHTSRHLAEFWMIEPEICFADLADDMALAEDYVKYCTAYALEHCADDIHFFEHEFIDKEEGLSSRLKNVIENDFAQITYTEGIEILQRDIAEKKVQFKEYPNWGDDLGSEHERYLAEMIFKRPTIVINYPKGIKAFYMKLNDDGETVAAMDILVPKIGELVGGSQREDRYEVLEKRCVDMGLDPKDMWWYLELRKYGTVPHAGFGLGFERLIMFITGLRHIQDVIPFPRVPGKAEF